MTETTVPDMMAEPPTSDPGLPNPSSTHSFWHTPPSSFLHAHRTTASLPSSVKTIIIGSGISGSMLYHHLHSLGLSNATLMLEARNTCWGATGRNGGHCKPMLYQANDFLDLCNLFGADETLKRIRFEQLNLELVKEYISAEHVDCEWAESPSADVFYELAPFNLAKQSIAALSRLAPDIAAHIRIVENRRELRESLRTPTAVGAVAFTAGKLSPYKLVSHILEKGVKYQGLNLQTTTPALSVSRSLEGKWVVATPRGTMLAERVIFATNAHTSHLLPVFKGWIYPVRAQMSALIPPKSLKDRPLTHTYGLVRNDRKTACYLIQRPIDEDGGGGELMLGGGREFEERKGVGLQDGAINAGVAQSLRTSVAGYFTDETGYDGEETMEENRELRRSFIEKFRRLRLGGGAGHDVWDAAEGMGFDDSDDLEGRKKGPQRGKECKARMEWSGTMGFSRDERPFVGRVPPVGEEDAKRLGIPTMPDTKGLWMLAGFEGHGLFPRLRHYVLLANKLCVGMAFTPGSAKALAAMINAESEGSGGDRESYEWFPKTFEVTPIRLGLLEEEEDNWEELGRNEDWELVELEG
ncbi:FAD dependent oxidoreductase [Trichophaea hybrida]|nr:FAD dependent oxidoreductase [Trichophaea hybrida]